MRKIPTVFRRDPDDLKHVLPEVTHDELRGYLLMHTFEGIVWHHPDGRMAKLKRRDFR